MIWITNTFLSKYQKYEGTQPRQPWVCVSWCFLDLNFTKALSVQPSQLLCSGSGKVTFLSFPINYRCTIKCAT